VFQPPPEDLPPVKAPKAARAAKAPRATAASKAAKAQAAEEAPPAEKARAAEKASAAEPEVAAPEPQQASSEGVDPAAPEDGDTPTRKRRRRGGRGRKKSGESSIDSAGEGGEAAGDAGAAGETPDAPSSDDGDGDAGDEGGSPSSRRRRRRRRKTGDGDAEGRTDDASDTVVRVREHRRAQDEVTSTRGSTRVEAKKQRRRDGRDAGRRRPTIMTESEFLARREAVERVMVVRQRGTRDAPMSQIAVLEDGVLVEHYVDQGTQRSIIGNIYLGRVQNVLPAMEAAFVDIGRGRNAVLYAGEVDWSRHEGKPKRIEEALQSGQSVLVQVSKDPIGHKGARLTSSISLPGRFVVYVPGGSMSGVSRKLSDTERSRLRTILKDVVPDEAEVIIRTAAEGAGEEELRRDVARLRAQWEDIERKVGGNASAPLALYTEPDLTLKIVRDIFNEDFASLVVAGDDAWDTIEPYVAHVAPGLTERLRRWDGEQDVFEDYRVDEQIAKALERKVWLPSGGSLVIDRTEAMTVVDVNTGKFTGGGGNLEETVTRNNLEAAEEVARQLRLRDIGGIIVVDFIDMVLEANRDLVLRRLVECLARDRTRHQVAEVTSLGLVQMTRKRIGTGLLETFSTPCDCCGGRGVVTTSDPVTVKQGSDDRTASQRRRSSTPKRAASPRKKAAAAPADESASAPQQAPAPVEEPTPAPAEAGGEAASTDAV
jgi:ribonuclease E